MRALILAASLLTQEGNFPIQELHRMSTTLPQHPTYSYPYQGLGMQLAKEGNKFLLLFAYGSLMDRESAARTLSANAMRTVRPAIGFGIKRLFDRDVALGAAEKKLDPRASGVLNIQRTERLEEFVNGVLIEVPLVDLEALLQREGGYDLIPLVTTDWEEFLEGKVHFRIAYALHAKQGSRYTNSAILPHRSYHEVVRAAAGQYGPLFSLLWYQSTYLADGKTSVAEWELR